MVYACNIYVIFTLLCLGYMDFFAVEIFVLESLRFRALNDQIYDVFVFNIFT